VARLLGQQADVRETRAEIVVDVLRDPAALLLDGAFALEPAKPFAKPAVRPRAYDQRHAERGERCHAETEPPRLPPLGLDDERRRPGSKRGTARWTADRAVDKIRDRFGWEAVGYASVVLGTSRSVPDEFRELAEKDL